MKIEKSEVICTPITWSLCQLILKRQDLLLNARNKSSRKTYIHDFNLSQQICDFSFCQMPMPETLRFQQKHVGSKMGGPKKPQVKKLWSKTEWTHPQKNQVIGRLFLKNQ